MINLNKHNTLHKLTVESIHFHHFFFFAFLFLNGYHLFIFIENLCRY